MPTTKFQVTSAGELIGNQHTFLRDAVLAAATYDGFGASFERMNNDAEIHPSFPMRLFGSSRHIGNNDYAPQPGDAFICAESNNADDDAAEAEVAAEIFKYGTFHARHSISITELTYDDADALIFIDGNPIKRIADEMEDTVENVQKYYDARK